LFLSSYRIVPEVRCKGFFFLVLQFYVFLIDVKDTSLTQPGDLKDLVFDLMLSFDKSLRKNRINAWLYNQFL